AETTCRSTRHRTSFSWSAYASRRSNSVTEASPSCAERSISRKSTRATSSLRPDLGATRGLTSNGFRLFSGHEDASTHGARDVGGARRGDRADVLLRGFAASARQVFGP